jgi:hypothetical protein
MGEGKGMCLLVNFLKGWTNKYSGLGGIALSRTSRSRFAMVSKDVAYLSFLKVDSPLPMATSIL